MTIHCPPTTSHHRYLSYQLTNPNRNANSEQMGKWQAIRHHQSTTKKPEPKVKPSQSIKEIGNRNET
jgi:hypothetical protein